MRQQIDAPELPRISGSPEIAPDALGQVRQGRSGTELSVCVIGAGPSGLCTVKALKERGFESDCYEMGTHVGGLWAFENDNGRGGTYRSLHINTSTRQMEFRDFPMPSDIGDFPSHVHMAEYFRAYADRFGLLEHIHFRNEVTKCTPTSRGYDVTVLDRARHEVRTLHYDAVIVANGHHFSPSYPPEASFRGFAGQVLHSHDYVDPRTPDAFDRQRVLIVGMGNSAMDIACELSREGLAAAVTIAARRGAWVLPKYLLGKPIDQGRIIPLWLPKKFRRHLVTWAFRLIHGRMEDYGLPKPDHLIGEAHPTISSELPRLVREGRISMRAGFESATGRTVRFSDGSTGEFDTIVMCTGYDVKFPFFEESHISAPDNVLPLYHRAFHLEHRRVFFVGLAQTVGAIMPVAEKQARLIALHLAGEYNLPRAAVMQSRIDAEEAALKKRFVPSRRHTMQVIVEDFEAQLKKDLLEGRVRARKSLGIAFRPSPHRSTLPSSTRIDPS